MRWPSSIIRTAPIAKFGRDEGARPLPPFQRPVGCLPQLVEVEAGRADDDADARVQARDRVAERGVGDREVDDDVGVGEDVAELGVERRVGAAAQLEPVGLFDGLADGRAHAPGGAGDRDSDRDRASAQLMQVGLS